MCAKQDFVSEKQVRRSEHLWQIKKIKRGCLLSVSANFLVNAYDLDFASYADYTIVIRALLVPKPVHQLQDCFDSNTWEKSSSQVLIQLPHAVTQWMLNLRFCQ